jgi:hypothetical protein
MDITSEDRVAKYRERARLARKVAAWLSLRGERSQGLKAAKHWEILADQEEHRRHPMRL